MVSNESDPLRAHLLKVLSWEDAHVPFDRAVKGVPARARGVRPEGLAWSIWQLVEHIRLAQWDILEFCRNPRYRAPKWPDDYWPESPEPPDAAAWRKSVAAVVADRRAVERLVASPDFDPFAEIPHGEGQTFLREVLLIADHNAYHVGEIVTIRRLMGIWT
jgi:hypothetical protein